MKPGSKRPRQPSDEAALPVGARGPNIRLKQEDSVVGIGSTCPYLAQVNRKALDFEMQRRCSVSMSKEHVHMCLVCGKYFRGREPGSPAYQHALEHEHYVFLAFDDAEVWCLPDDYGVYDASLDDILAALRPKFKGSTIAAIDSNSVLVRSTEGKDFLPGYVGLDNTGSADFISVALQSISHVRPFRDFFLRASNYSTCTSKLVQGLGDTIRRLWSPGLFKPSVSPHDFVVQIWHDSNGRFRPGQQGEAVDLLSWLLQRVHAALLFDYSDAQGARQRAKEAEAAARMRLDRRTGLGRDSGSSAFRQSGPVPAVEAVTRGFGSDRMGSGSTAAQAGKSGPGQWWLAGGTGPGKSIVTECFEGVMEVQEILGGRSRTGDELRSGRTGTGTGAGAVVQGDGRPVPVGLSPLIEHELRLVTGDYEVTRETRPFLFLSTDLPPVPVFVEEQEDGRAQVVPEVLLHDIMTRFGGKEVVESLEGGMRRRSLYRVIQLPTFLALHVRRFTHNAFFAEKNPTRVAFPLRNLQLDAPMRMEDGKPLSVPCTPAAGALASAPKASVASSTESAASSASGSGSGSAATVAASGPSLSKGQQLAIKLLRVTHPSLCARLSSQMTRQQLAHAASKVDASTARRALQLRLALRYRTKLDLECSIVHDSPPEMAKGSTAAAQAAAARLASHRSTVEKAAESAAQQALRRDGARAGSGRSSGGPSRDALATNSAFEATENAMQALRAGTYRVHVKHAASNSWYELRDVKVSMADPEQITPGETYALVYVKQGAHELRAIEASVEKLLLQD